MPGLRARGGRRDGEGSLLDDAFHHDRGGEPLHAGQCREFLVAEVLVGGDVGGGDADEVVGVAKQPFCVAHLGDLHQAALEFRDRRGVLSLLAGALATMLARRGQAKVRPAVLISAWAALLAAAVTVAGRTGLGTLLTAAFVLQVTPSIWTAYRIARPTGISRGTWILVLGELSCWTAFGVHKSDPRLMILGFTGVTASLLMLARIHRTTGIERSTAPRHAI
jgi:hypothetical protein